jgi:hypothetical protein
MMARRPGVGTNRDDIPVVGTAACHCPCRGTGCDRTGSGVNGVVLMILAAQAAWIILSGSGPDSDQLEDLYATLGEGPVLMPPSQGPVAAVDLIQAQREVAALRCAGCSLAAAGSCRTALRGVSRGCCWFLLFEGVPGLSA